MAPSLRYTKAFISVHELASHFGISPRRVEQLCKAGVIQNAGRGKYDLRDCTRRYIRHLKEWRLAAAVPASTNDLARCFKLFPAEINALSKAGVLPKIDHGRYDFVACAGAYIAHIQRDGQLLLLSGGS